MVTDDTGKFITSAAEKADKIAEFFGAQLSAPAMGTLPPFKGPPRSLSNPIALDEVRACLGRLSSNRASGPDSIPAELYKFSGPETPSIVVKALNDIFALHSPIDTNVGVLVPLPKPGKPRGPVSSLRPVALLNALRKLLSLIVLNRIRPKLEAFIDHYQAGFRPGRSTTDIVFTWRWLCSLVITFELTLYKLGIDLSHAFDSLDRQRLMFILEADANLNEDDCRMIRYLFSDMELRVRVYSETSKPFISNLGAPQGDGLSAFIFIYYLDKAMKEARCSFRAVRPRPPRDIELGLPELTAYADDVDSISVSKVHLESELESFEMTLNTWNLQINKTKTEWTKIELCPLADRCPACQQSCSKEAILCDGCGFWWHYSCAHLSQAQVSVLVDDPNSVFKCDMCKNFKRPLMRGREPWRSLRVLGSLLDDDEDAKNRMRLAAMAFKQHTKLWMRRHLLSLSTRIRIYKAYVLPTLIYNIGALALSQKTADKLDAFHKRQLRHVMGIFWPDQISSVELYKRTNSVPISRLMKERRWSLIGHILRLPRETPAFVAMQTFFRASTFLRRRCGRPRTCLAAAICQDLLDSFHKHMCLLKSLSDLELLRQKAQNRTAWLRLTRAVLD